MSNKKHQDIFHNQQHEQLQELIAFEYDKKPTTIKIHHPFFASRSAKTKIAFNGEISIEYMPNKLWLELDSLLAYLDSFKSSYTFFEDAIEDIFEAVQKACSPKHLQVTGIFNHHGNIQVEITKES